MTSVNLPPSDSNSVYALLSAVADPKTAKHNLDKITKATADMNAATDANRKVATELEAVKKEHQQILADIDQSRQDAIEEHDALLKNITDKKAKLEELVTKASTDVSVAEAKVKAANTLDETVNQRLSDVVARETAANMREKDVYDRERKVAALDSQLNEKLNKLRQIVNV